jgi:hypothetical protein
VKNVEISGTAVANNVADNEDGHGIYVNAAAVYVNLHDITSGNVLDAGGHQKYGIKIARVAANHLMIHDNQLSKNESGGISNADTGTYSILANDVDESSRAIQSVLSGKLRNAQPACDASHRGQINYTEGPRGVADIAEICVKNAADAYAWRRIF